LQRDGSPFLTGACYLGAQGEKETKEGRKKGVKFEAAERFWKSRRGVCAYSNLTVVIIVGKRASSFKEEESEKESGM